MRATGRSRSRSLRESRLPSSSWPAAPAIAQSAVTLAAGPTTTTLPDGQIVPMWGYSCGAVSGAGVSCTAMNGAATDTAPGSRR